MLVVDCQAAFILQILLLLICRLAQLKLLLRFILLVGTTGQGAFFHVSLFGLSESAILKWPVTSIINWFRCTRRKRFTATRIKTTSLPLAEITLILQKYHRLLLFELYPKELREFRLHNHYARC